MAKLQKTAKRVSINSDTALTQPLFQCSTDNPVCVLAAAAQPPPPSPSPQPALKQRSAVSPKHPAPPPPPAPLAAPAAAPAPALIAISGKVHLRIEKSGRSGKTVTVLFGSGITDLTPQQRETLLRELKRTLGVGGTTSPDTHTIEIQGDTRARLQKWLAQKLPIIPPALTPKNKGSSLF
ncbi:MAG: translation initiation factor [Puniceicoccales bacterium]|jgi:translation initiation factor 1 (eIF-1/SUI1)|nr:translation initiation factor [Puniceicoccales bacterium]